MGNFFHELKRRKVFRVGAVYVVAAWVLIQVADTIAPLMNLSESAPRLVLFLLIILFPVALFLAWAYEVNPDGVQSVSKTQTLPRVNESTDRKLIYAIFGLVLLLSAIQVSDRILGNQGGRGAANFTSLPTPGESTVLRASLNLEGPLPRANNGLRTLLGLSPDGSQLYYSNFASPDLDARVASLDLSSGNTQSLFSGFQYPVASPDGRNLLMMNPVTIQVLNLTSGSVTTISNDNLGAGWYSPNEILFVNEQNELILADTRGLVLESYGAFEPSEGAGPFRRLADTEHILYTYTGSSPPEIRLFSLPQLNEKTLIHNGYSPRYVETGHLLFMRSNALYAAEFDVTTREITGPEVVVIEGIDTATAGVGGRSGIVGLPAVAVSDTGRLIYLPGIEAGGISGKRDLLLSDLEGNTQTLSVEPRHMRHPSLSPDGQKLALTVYDDDGGSDLWIFNLERNSFLRRTFTGEASRAVWGPDSNSLIYQDSPADRGELWRINADGTGLAEQIYAGEAEAESVSLDGERILFIEGPIGSTAIKGLTLQDGAWVRSSLIDTEVPVHSARISPDGRWMAYVSPETGAEQVYVAPYPDVSAGKWQVSAGSPFGTDPVWSPAGDALFFISVTDDGRRTLMRAELAAEGNQESVFDFFPPQSLFPIAMNDGNDPPHFAVTSDGQHILHFSEVDTIEDYDGQNYASFNLVDNWFEELVRLATPPE